MANVHLRVLTSEDADWVVVADTLGGRFARPQGWRSVDAFATELDEGRWASDDRWAWAVVSRGEPIGFAVLRGLASADAELEIRISPDARGRGAGREVLRQLADHHFAEHRDVHRLTGRTHEQNVAMQRAFAAAGFRMEARYRDSYRHDDDTTASEWGYALTRSDWQAGRHRTDDAGYDLHGLTFVVEVEDDQPRGPWVGTILRFLQEGRRALAKYDGDHATDGELGGILLRDVLSYRYVHDFDGVERRGGGRSRVQRRHDGRLELVDEWIDDKGGRGERRAVEVRERPGQDHSQN
jgi:RimJ/RimL family protein N-acetyltransferase